jgi:hypothetical protein
MGKSRRDEFLEHKRLRVFDFLPEGPYNANGIKVVLRLSVILWFEIAALVAYFCYQVAYGATAKQAYQYGFKLGKEAGLSSIKYFRSSSKITIR